MPQETKQEKSLGLVQVGPYVEALVNARADSLDEALPDSRRKEAQFAYLQGLDELFYYAASDATVGPDVVNVLNRLHYSDALKRSESGNLYEPESKAVESARKAWQATPEYAAAKGRGFDPYQPTDAEFLYGIYGKVDPFDREEGPVRKVQRGRPFLEPLSDPHAVVLDSNVYDAYVDMNSKESKHAAQALYGEIEYFPGDDDEWRPFVKTDKGHEPLHSFTKEQRKAITLGMKGLGEGTIVGWAAHKILGDEAGEDYNIRGIGGITWAAVPNVNNNRELDKWLIQNDPVWVRSLLHAEPSGEGLLAAGNALVFLADLGGLMGATKLAGRGVAAGARAGRATKAGQFAERLSKGMGVQRLGKAYAGAMGTSLKGGEAATAMQLPVASGTMRSFWDMMYYSSARNAITGQGTLSEGLEEGATLGALGVVFGGATRVFRRTFLNWTAGKMARKGMFGNWGKRLADPGAEAFGKEMQRTSDWMRKSLKRYFQNENLSTGFGNIHDSWMVGLGFGAHAYAQEMAMREGVEWDLTNPKIWGYFLDGLTSETAMGTASGFGFGTASGTVAYRMKLGPGRAQQRDQAKIIARAVRSMRAREQAMEDMPEVMEMAFFKAVKDNPESALSWFESFLHDASARRLNRFVRDEMGERDPLSGDPHDVSSFKLKDLHDIARQDPESARDMVNDMPRDVLKLIHGEMKSLPVEGEGLVKRDVSGLREMVSGALRDRFEGTHAEQMEKEDAALARAHKRLVDPYSASLQEKVGRGRTLADATKEEVAEIGYKDPKHALNSVNSRRRTWLDAHRKEPLTDEQYEEVKYQAYRDVPLGDVMKAAKERLNIMPRLVEQVQADLARLKERATRGSDGILEPVTESQIRVATSRVYEALKTTKGFQGMEAGEIAAKWFRESDFESPRTLAERVLEAERLRARAPLPDPEARDVDLGGHGEKISPDASPQLSFERDPVEGFDGAQANAAAALETLARIRSRQIVENENGTKDEVWSALFDPTESLIRSEDAKRMMSSLLRGDQWLLERFEQSVDPDGTPTFESPKAAAEAFAGAKSQAQAAREWTVQTMLDIARRHGRGTGTGAAMEAIRMRNSGQRLPDELVKTLRRFNLVDESGEAPKLKEGIETRLARDFMEGFVREVGDKSLATIYGTMRPLDALAGFGVARFHVDHVDPLGMIVGKVLFPFKPTTWLDAMRKRHLSGKAGAIHRTTDRAMGFIWRNLLRPIWESSVSVPQRSLLASSEYRRTSEEARWSEAEINSRAREIVLKGDVLLRDMMSAGLDYGDMVTLHRAIEGGSYRRIKNPEDFARVWKLDSAKGAVLFDVMGRYIEHARELGRFLWRGGGLTDEQLRKHDSTYVMHVAAKHPNDILEEAVTQQKLNQGTVGREMSRELDPLAEQAQLFLDMRYILPVETAQEASRGALLQVLRSRAIGGGSRTTEEYRSWPKVEQAMWTRAAVLPKEYLGMDRATQKTVTRGALMLGRFLTELDAGIQSGKVPETQGKREIIDNLKSRYVTFHEAKNLEILLQAHDPTFRGVEDFLAAPILYWRQVHTAFNPRHIMLNLTTSVLTNHMLSKVPATDFFTSVIYGHGAYADAAHGAMDWHDWTLGQGAYEGWGSKNRNKLKGDAREADILQFDRFAHMAGGATLEATLLEDVSWRGWLGSIFTPTNPAEVPTNLGAMEEQGYAVQEFMRKSRGQASQMHEFVGKMVGSTDPLGMAQAARSMLAFYQMNELWLKYAPTLSFLRANPAAEFGMAVKSSLEGTGDYGAANKNVTWATSMLRYHEGDRVLNARKDLKAMRKATGLDIELLGVQVPKMGSLAEARNIGWDYLPKPMRLGAQAFMQHPFLTYSHVMVPAMARGAALNPLSVAAGIGMAEVFRQAMSSTLGVVDEKLLRESQAGGPAFPEEKIGVAITDEAIDHIVDNYAIRHAFSMFGNDASGELSAWLDQNEDHLKEWMRDWLKGTKAVAISDAGMRGSQGHYFDWSEGFRPLVWWPEGRAAVKAALAGDAPWANQMNFFDHFAGLMGAAIVSGIRDGWTAVKGKKGESRSETLADLGSRFKNEWLALLGPAGMAGQTGERVMEELVLDGQPWQDAIVRGIHSPAIEEQGFFERMKWLASEQVFPRRRVGGLSMEKMPSGDAMDRLARFLDPKMGEAVSGTELSKERRVFARRLIDQSETWARDIYWMHTIGGIPPYGLDQKMGLAFNLSADLDETGFLVDEPRTMIGKFIEGQIARGVDVDLAMEVSKGYIESTALDLQKEVLTTVARKAQMHPQTFQRIWVATERDTGMGLINFIHDDLGIKGVGPGKITSNPSGQAKRNFAAYYRLWKEDVARHPNFEASSERGLIYERLQRFFGPIESYLGEQPYGERTAHEALGPQVFDIAPERAVAERPERDVFMPTLQALLKEGVR